MKKILNKILASVVALSLMICAVPSVYAADNNIATGTAGDGISWVIDAGGTLTISGNGAIETEWYEPAWENYNNYIKKIVIEEGITMIPSTVFSYMQNVVSVSIPSTVTSLPIDSTSPFWANSALEEINVASGNKTYTSVDGIVFTKDMKMLCYYPENKNGVYYAIPNGVTKVAKDAFSNNRNLRNVVIPDSVTTIGDNAFGDSGIRYISIGKGVKSIPMNCFQFCGNLKTIVIPDTVETIEYGAFWACNALSFVLMGNGIQTIGRDVFKYCSMLEEIHYKGTASEWGEVYISEEDTSLSSMDIHYVTEDDCKAATLPTCVKEGYTGGCYCVACDKDMGVTLDKIPHTYKDGKCQACSYECEHLWVSGNGKCNECGAKADIPVIKAGDTAEVHVNNEGACVWYKFEPEESGAYRFTSDNSKSYISDPFIDVFDDKFITIDYANDTKSDYNFDLVFYATAGRTYYIELGDYEDETRYDFTIEKYKSISHQPTSKEPYVDISWENNLSYQWYEIGGTEITDKNATAYVGAENYTASYDSEKGWTMESNGYYYLSYFSIDLKMGDVITVDVTGDDSAYAFISQEGIENGCYDMDAKNNIYKLTASEDGKYYMYVRTEKQGVSVRAYLGSMEYKKLGGQTTNTLTSVEFGKRYMCKATAGQTEYMSNRFTCTYAITHQPKADELYVTTNIDKDVKYQWHVVEKVNTEITDKNAIGIDESWCKSSYDSTKGWSAQHLGSYEGEYYDFFTLELKKGDILKVEVSGEYYGWVGLYNYAMHKDKWTYPESNPNTTYEFTIQEDGEYTLYTYSKTGNVIVRAYMDVYEYTSLDAETSNALKNYEGGKTYACEVTFADGRSEMSELVTIAMDDVNMGDDFYPVMAVVLFMPASLMVCSFKLRKRLYRQN